ncbi:MAG TPA: CpsB/CapC family capsule biosynthesis tyrosine phosphatase [Arachidicoccus sp.]
MFGFLRNKNNNPANNWKFVQTDIHSHILPGIDDGAKTIHDSIGLIKNMYNHGFRKMVATPHISEDIYPNAKETILERRDLVREKVAALKIDMKIDAAAEYMIDERFVSLAESEEGLLTIHGNHVLVEMSYLLESPFLHTALFTMQTRGYQPILAHPERYNFYHNDLEKYDELKEKGCLFQLNTIAFSGYYGKNVKKTAEYLFNKNMYDYCGSDIHHLRHIQALNSVLKSKIFNQLQEYPFLNNSVAMEEVFSEVHTLVG